MISFATPRIEFGTRAEARTKEIERCLKMSPTHIFMIDSDQTMPTRGISALLATGADISVIDAPSKGAGDSNVRYHPDGSLAYATISCCLIKASVFDRITKPWFSSSYAFREEGFKDGKIVWNVQEKQTDDNRDEDVYFMRKCIDAGLKIKVVPELKCAHFEIK